MIDRSTALSIARKHLADSPMPHPDYFWKLAEPRELPEGWYFDYQIDCRLPLPPSEWEAFGGAPGFLVLKKGGAVRVVSWGELP